MKTNITAATDSAGRGACPQAPSEPGRWGQRPLPLVILSALLCSTLAAGDKPAACCAAEPAPKPAACCPVEPAKKDLCCTAAEIQNYSTASLYQLDATFTADNGRSFTLGQLRGRPVVLTMFFASCGYACPLLLTDMQAIRGRLSAEQRDRVRFVLVSFDTARDTPQALAQYRAQRQLDGQWTLVHGDDGAVRELAALLGVKFKQEADGMFAHSNLITILNPEGEIVHQRTGLQGGLGETAAVIGRLTLASAP